MTKMELVYLSNYLQWGGSLVIVLLAFFFVKGRPTIITIVGYYGLFSFLFQAMQTISGKFLSAAYNNHIGNFYTLFELSIFLYLYYHALNRRVIRLIVLSIAIGYLFLFLITTAPSLQHLNSTTQTTRDFILMACAIGYFFFLIIDLPASKLQRLPMFWINSSVLFFFSCTFILSLSINYLTEALKDDFILYWGFRNLLRVLFCLIICVGIWKSYSSPNNKVTIGND